MCAWACEGEIVGVGMSPELDLVVALSNRGEVVALDYLGGTLRWAEKFEYAFDQVFVIREGVIIVRNNRQYLALDLAGKGVCKSYIESEYSVRLFDRIKGLFLFHL
jgi:hypothetical protein